MGFSIDGEITEDMMELEEKCRYTWTSSHPTRLAVGGVPLQIRLVCSGKDWVIAWPISTHAERMDMAKRPDPIEMPAIVCPQCGGTSKVPTRLGQKLLDFVEKYKKRG